MTPRLLMKSKELRISIKSAALSQCDAFIQTFASMHLTFLPSSRIVGLHSTTEGHQGA